MQKNFLNIHFSFPLPASFKDVCEMLNAVNTRLDAMDSRISNIELMLVSGNKPLNMDISMEEQPSYLPAQLWENLIDIDSNIKERKEERSALVCIYFIYLITLGNVNFKYILKEIMLMNNL